MEVKYKRSKRTPPKDTWCDTKTVDEENKGFDVKLKGCTNKATVELLGGFMGEVWVCETCAMSLLNKS